MRRLLLLVVVFTVAAGTAGSSPAKLEHALVYGLVQDSATTWLTRLDPDTLVPLGPRVSLGQLNGFAYDTNGWLAFADGRRIRIVDVRRMRHFKSVRLGPGLPTAVAWLRWDTIVVVTGRTVTEVRAIDWATDKVVRTARVQGTVVARARGDTELVLLVAPAAKIGPTRVLVIDPSGRTRLIPIPRIAAGQRWDDMNPPTGENRQPGLALDAERDVAYVVGDGLVAEIPLAGNPTYHALRGSFAKYVKGSWRSAALLAGGTLAIAGSDSIDGTRIEPSGLELVDTQTWTARMVDPGVANVVPWQGLALETGGSWGEGDPTRGTGLVAYDSSGTERFRALPGRIVWLGLLTPTRAYVRAFDALALVVDLPSGRVVSQPAGNLPFLLTLR